VDGYSYFADPSLAFNQYGTGWPGIAYFDSYLARIFHTAWR
jgi:hypothetical protein